MVKRKNNKKTHLNKKKCFFIFAVIFSILYLFAIYVAYNVAFNSDTPFSNLFKKFTSDSTLEGGCKMEEEGCFAKPIIYLYPPSTTEVSVTLGNPQNLTHTYPQYNAGWTITAEPNGNLFDKTTNRSYYALYWEGLNTVKQNFNEGFVIEGKNTIPFLQEKLKQLGLNERESNEFIIYWLPKLESSPYNVIRFQTMEEQNKNMPLIITPKPDTMIRVMMEFKNLDTPINIKEQILPTTPNRTGFVSVEWGGTDLSNNILK